MKYIVFSVLIFFGLLSGSEVIRGGNYSEKKVYLSWSLLINVVYSCYVQPSECGLTAVEKKTLIQISNNLAKFSDPSRIQIVSEKSNPHLFEVASGTHRIAVTGNQPDSKIYINKEQLSEHANISIAELIGLLAHEVGHHTGLKDSEEYYLENFGSKIANMYLKNVQHITRTEDVLKQVEVLIFSHISNESFIQNPEYEAIGTSPLIYVLDGQNIIQVGERISYLFDCFYGAELNQYFLPGLRWLSVSSKKDSMVLVAATNESHYCRMPNHGAMRVSGLTQLILHLSKDLNNQYYLDQKPNIQVTEVNNNYIETDVSKEDFLGLPELQDEEIDVLSIKTNNQILNEGDIWTVDAILEGDFSLKSYDCSVVISSDDFNLTYASGQKIAFETKPSNCKLKRLNQGRIEIIADYVFPKPTPSRTYYIKGIKLIDKNTKEFVGRPQIRTQVVLNGTNSIIPIKHESVLLRGDKKLEVLSPNFGYLDTKWCQRFQIEIDLNTELPVNQSYIWYRVRYQNDMFDPVIATQRLTHAMSNWQYEVEKLKPGVAKHKFDLYLEHEFWEPENFWKYDFFKINFLTQNLQEYIIDFPEESLGLFVHFPGLACGANNN